MIFLKNQSFAQGIYENLYSLKCFSVKLSGLFNIILKEYCLQKKKIAKLLDFF